MEVFSSSFGFGRGFCFWKSVDFIWGSFLIVFIGKGYILFLVRFLAFVFFVVVYKVKDFCLFRINSVLCDVVGLVSFFLSLCVFGW